MKIITTRTRFEFDEEERKAIEMICPVLVSIYENMSSGEHFIDYDMYDISGMANFFGELKSALDVKGFIEMD